MRPDRLSIALVHPGVPVLGTFERLGRSHLPPLGPLYVAAALIEQGHRVRVFDLNLDPDPERLVDSLRHDPPQVLGLGTLAPAFHEVTRLARTLRRRLPAWTRLVAGGPDVSVRPGLYQGLGLFDALLLGEAEQTLVHLCAAYPDIPEEAGVLPRDRSASLARLAPPLHPDDLALPARDLLPLRRYRGGPAYKKQRRSTSLFSHRGCPFACSFCEKGVHRGAPRFRSAESIFEEMCKIKVDYGISDIRFMDDMFLARPATAQELARALCNSSHKFSWMCTARVDMLDKDVLKDLARAGCHRLELGVESGSPRIVELVHKRIELGQAQRAIALCRQMGLESVANFILGFPTETAHDMDQTLRFALRLDPDFAIFFAYTPFAGSELVHRFDIPVMGPDPPDLDRHPAFPVLRREVMARVEQAYRRFYLRPGLAARRLLAAPGPWLVWDLGRMAVAIISSGGRTTPPEAGAGPAARRSR